MCVSVGRSIRQYRSAKDAVNAINIDISISISISINASTVRVGASRLCPLSPPVATYMRPRKTAGSSFRRTGHDLLYTEHV